MPNVSRELLKIDTQQLCRSLPALSNRGVKNQGVACGSGQPCVILQFGLQLPSAPSCAPQGQHSTLGTLAARQRVEYVARSGQEHRVRHAEA